MWVLRTLQGDLGAIDEKYDVAVSTAIGALDNIVCDNMDTAQKCVEYLKQSGVGMATFIGLDKVLFENTWLITLRGKFETFLGGMTCDNGFNNSQICWSWITDPFFCIGSFFRVTVPQS